MEDYKIFLPLVMNIVRYFIFAGLAYFVFYVWQRQAFIHRKIQQKFPDWKQHRRDIFYSVLSGFIFGTMGILVILARKNGYTMLYSDIQEYGVLYLVFSIIALIFIHDTYFYWTHRLMHHPKLFKWIHKVHHQSHNPSPWTSFAFHPTEAVIEAAFPIHPLAAFILLLYSIIMNVLGHTGFEYHSKDFLKHKFFKWFNTPTHHNMHHQYSRGNYGLYFNIWDRIMKTNDVNYEKRFDEIQERIEISQQTENNLELAEIKKTNS
jgi:Delta7-sterol 5-desaturase